MKNISSADAVSIIRELCAQGQALTFIAGALTRRGIPTPSGRAKWHHYMVARLAQAHGITAGWRPTAHAINSASAGARASSRVGVRPAADASQRTG